MDNINSENQNNDKKKIEELHEIYRQFRIQIGELKKKYDNDISNILKEADKKKMEEILKQINKS